MTARSPRGGRLAFDASQWEGTGPEDAYVVRDGLANALLACADEGGAPPMATWGAKKASLIPGTPVQYVTASNIVGNLDIWYPLATLGPYSLPVFTDRKPYAIRALLFGASQTGDPVDFVVRVGQLSQIGDVYGGAPEEQLAFTGETSTTPVQLTPDGASNVIVLGDGAVRAARAPRTTLDDTGGVNLNVLVYEVYARVWGRCVGKGPDHAHLYGAHVAAFVGAA